MPRARDDAHRAVFDAWRDQRGSRYPELKGARLGLDKDRRNAIDDALSMADYTVDELCDAVRGFVMDAQRDRSDARVLVWALETASNVDEGLARAQRCKLGNYNVPRKAEPTDAVAEGSESA